LYLKLDNEMGFELEGYHEREFFSAIERWVLDKADDIIRENDDSVTESC